MTRLQQVLWTLEMDYLGHPYYVSGNAIVNALGQPLASETVRSIHASHGLFAPGQFGSFPAAHSQNGVHPHLGGSLPAVETYDDLFLFRDPTQSWLLDSRPRDALNVHPIRTQHGQPALAHETIMARPDDHRKEVQTTTWYIHAYLHADDPDVLPLDRDTLEGLQLGGQRNYGYGLTRLKDTQVVDLEDLDYERLRDCDAHCLDIVTPYVLHSEFPGTNDVTVPWWWHVDEGQLRHREERLVRGDAVYRCETIDHGQVVGYAGDRPVETAKHALTRVGPHSKYGFGELRVRPLDSQTGESLCGW